MDQKNVTLFFALLRSALRGNGLSAKERDLFSPETVQDLIKLSEKHDLSHLISLGLKQNHLIPNENAAVQKNIFKTVFRYERLQAEYENLCNALQEAQIPFLPLKGSVLRGYYPEPWMRTSCDIDILVHREDLERAVAFLTKNQGYAEAERSTHDVSLFSPGRIHVELHFDLMEEGRANDAIQVLSKVWDEAHLHSGSLFHYEMSDAFFYFYHIAHMAKHFESGGCGIRPFLDLWILDHLETADSTARDALLSRGGLLKFAETAKKMSRVWFGEEQADAISLQMQQFLLSGGSFGTSENRVALQQKKMGGRFGYLLSRIFIPYDKLKRYYPVLEKHRWLTPFMQVRRWFMLFRPEVATMAKNELEINRHLKKERANEMEGFLKAVGL